MFSMLSVISRKVYNLKKINLILSQPNFSANEISKNVVNTLKKCGEVFRECKNKEDEAIAYVARYC